MSLRKRPRAAIVALAATVALVAAALTTTLNSPPSLAQDGELPNSFSWESSGALVAPQAAPGRDLVSIKDPTVVNTDGQWHVYATTADTEGRWSLTYFGGFTDWSQAGQAQQYHLSQTPIGDRYAAAPQLFYFEPRDEWYLVYQTGLPSFSLLDHPGRPETATAPRQFMDAHDPIVEDTMGEGGYVVDYWVTCDETDCYLFFNNSNGYFFQASTSLAEFPNGFGDTRILMSQPGDNDLFEALNLYKVGDTGQYLLLIEAIGSDGRRYFRSWTANSLDATGSEWTPLAESESNPFARSNNVTFPGGAWTQDISHGELLRAGNDQTLTIDPCNMRYLYQGLDPDASGDYSQLPWRLGLLTQTGSPCDPDEEPTSDEPTDPVTGDCTATVEVVNDWGSGWQGEVTVRAGDADIGGWDLSWTWPGGQQISSAWNADWSQSGAGVTAGDVGWNGQIAAGESRTVFGFIASGPPASPEADCSAA